MSSASFDESVHTLLTMFPEQDPVVVRSVLEARDGHVESAVEKLLAMSRRNNGARNVPPGTIGMSPHGGGSSSSSGYAGGRGSGGMGSNDFYSNVPPPREEESLWGWLTGDDSSTGQGSDEMDETWNWISNQMSYLALEASRQLKGVTDAIAEEILGPPEEELGEEVEEITEEERERADVVAGGMAMQANRRTTQPKTTPKPKPKKPIRHAEYDDDEEDDALGGILNLLGLEDDEDEDEPYVRRDSKKDK